jgi:hypothetical protein
MTQATAYNAHYLFEDGVLDFDKPVEIHVSRFANNQQIVDSSISSYPKYDILFTNPKAFKVYINCNEPITSSNRERTEVVIANHGQYDLILTSDTEILRNCDNAVLFPYGTTWLNKGHINHPDGLGVYDESLDELCENKKFEVSFLCSVPNRNTRGRDIRRLFWNERNKIPMPTRFYTSTRNPIEGGEMLPEDDKKHLFNSQYHIVIESSCVTNYFTEKLIDAMLTKTVPIYWGCPNIYEFFDMRGMFLVENEQAIVSACTGFIKENTYENLLPFIEENYKRAKQFAKSFAVRVKEQIENKINNNEKLLTIGILSLNERKEKYLDRLLKSLGLQLTVELKEKVEVMVNVDDGEKSVGQKRNEILNNASGKFICFVDDDDGVDEEYIKTIIDVIENNNKLDCIGFSGMYYVNGKPRMLFKHANKYGGHYKDSSGVQHRPANHLNPVKTKIAQKVGFPEKNFGEDSDYCDRLFDTGLLKDEVILDKVMYHYYWASEVSRTH